MSEAGASDPTAGPDSEPIAQFFTGDLPHARTAEDPRNAGSTRETSSPEARGPQPATIKYAGISGDATRAAWAVDQFSLAGPRPPVEAPTTPPARVREAEELVEWGRHRYADEGLRLPEITLVVHPSLQQCGGRVGRSDERTNELVLCRIDRDTVLHELAHAWIDHNLDEADRARFVELRAVDEWNDRSQE